MMTSSSPSLTRGYAVDIAIPDLRQLKVKELIERVNGHKYLYRVHDSESHTRTYHIERGSHLMEGGSRRKYGGFASRKYLDRPAPSDPSAAFSEVPSHLDWGSNASSPWISTTSCWAWAVCEAQRRANEGIRGVAIFVIDATKISDGENPTAWRAKYYAVELLRLSPQARSDYIHFANAAQEVLVYARIPSSAVLARILLSTQGSGPAFLDALPAYFVPNPERAFSKPPSPFKTVWNRSANEARRYEDEDAEDKGRAAAKLAIVWLWDQWEVVYQQDGPDVKSLKTIAVHTCQLGSEFAYWLHTFDALAAFERLQRGIALEVFQVMSIGRHPRPYDCITVNPHMPSMSFHFHSDSSSCGPDNLSCPIRSPPTGVPQNVREEAKAYAEALAKLVESMQCMKVMEDRKEVVEGLAVLAEEMAKFVDALDNAGTIEDCRIAYRKMSVASRRSLMTQLRLPL